MARKTKAELALELANQNAYLEATAAATYLSRLMTALEEATNKSNYELTVRDSMFVLYDRNESEFFADLNPEYNKMTDESLDQLENELRWKATQRAEDSAKALARSTALAKLTKAERELLALPNY